MYYVPTIEPHLLQNRELISKPSFSQTSQEIVSFSFFLAKDSYEVIIHVGTARRL